MTEVLKVKIGDRWYTVEVLDLDADPVQATVDGEPVQVAVEREPSAARALPRPPAPVVDRASVAPLATGKPAVGRDDGPPSPRPKAAARPDPVRAPGARKLLSAPMPGVILSVKVKAGETVVTGDEICVLEAMKMQQNLRSDWSGIIKRVHVESGQQVLSGDPIAELE